MTYRFADVLQDADFVQRLLKEALLISNDFDGDGIAVLAVDRTDDLTLAGTRDEPSTVPTGRLGRSRDVRGAGARSARCLRPTHLSKGPAPELVHDLEAIVQVVAAYELELAVLVVVACSGRARGRVFRPHAQTAGAVGCRLGGRCARRAHAP